MSIKTMCTSSDRYTHANRIFVQSISARKRESSSMLDVGCWNGTLGQVLMTRCSAVVDGIEIDAAQAENAGNKGYRKVYCLDLNRDAISVVDKRYDFILFGDVLEHLLDSRQILRDAAGLLNPGGTVMVSLPNIAFITCRLKHLLGRWDYADYGIMDRTHVRFFTRRTMIEMLKECGYEVEWIKGYVGLYGYPWLVRKTIRCSGVCGPPCLQSRS